jgi:hypothetical protein
MKKSELHQIIREEIKTAITELESTNVSSHDVDSNTKTKVKSIVQDIEKKYNLTEDDAVMYLLAALKRLGYNVPRLKDYKL